MSRPIQWLASASCLSPPEPGGSQLRLTKDRNFGPSLVPLLQVGWRGIVQTDAGFRAHITSVQNHRDACKPPTWDAMTFYAKKLRANKTKVAFFSSTPQGGGVALMRHALVRFSRLMGVDLTWYGEYCHVLGQSTMLIHRSPEASPRCLPHYQERPQHSSRCQPSRPTHFQGRKGCYHRLDFR